MSAGDTFSVYLHSLPAGEVEYRAIDDGRHILAVNRDVWLLVRPGEDDLPAAVAGLRKLAEAAGEMAGALSEHGKEG